MHAVKCSLGIGNETDPQFLMVNFEKIDTLADGQDQFMSEQFSYIFKKRENISSLSFTVVRTAKVISPLMT